ncbi:MAG: calcium-binding protein [Verrucomicrobia bacterium]|nr:calcium-binding protein [Verrucomicrobiota bacterium]
MPIPKRDYEREERIAMEIVVDCYNESEARQGWWCYLDGKLACPFEAECIRTRRGSPLKIGERVTVTAMLDDDEAGDSLGEMQVEIEWRGRTLGVPLAQLSGVGVTKETAEAIADWHYWLAQGRSSDSADSKPPEGTAF